MAKKEKRNIHIVSKGSLEVHFSQKGRVPTNRFIAMTVYRSNNDSYAHLFYCECTERPLGGGKAHSKILLIPSRIRELVGRLDMYLIIMTVHLIITTSNLIIMTFYLIL